MAFTAAPRRKQMQAESEEIVRLREIVEEGESDTCEFKIDFSDQAHSIAKEIAALANTKGGLLLIGVSDDGQMIGIENSRSAEERLVGIASTCSPSISIEVDTVRLDSKAIIVVSVPCTPISTYKGHVYTRIGTVSRYAEGGEIVSMLERGLLQRVQLKKDDETEEKIGKTDLIREAHQGNTAKQLAPPLLVVLFVTTAAFLLKDVVGTWIYLALALGAVWLAIQFLYISPRSKAMMLAPLLPDEPRVARYIGDGSFISDNEDEYFYIYRMTAPCIYPGCDEGKIIVVNSPQREFQKTGKEYVGVCTAAGNDHSYRVDYTGIATPERYDWSAVEERQRV